MSDRPAFFRPESPAPDAAAREGADLGVAAWAVDLERAHDVTRRACRVLEGEAQPVIDLTPAARALERALGAIFDALDLRDDSLTAARRASSALEEALSALAPGAALDPAIQRACVDLRTAGKHLGDAATRLAPLVPRARPFAPDLVASRDRPRLHVLDRPSLVPDLRVPQPPPAEVIAAPPPPIARPRTFEELDLAMAELHRRAAALPTPIAIDPDRARAAAPAAAVAPPPGFARVPDPPETAIAFVRARARDLFEEVAMIGAQRAPLLGDPWRTALVLERRMFAAIDAIVALGPAALASLVPLVFDAPVIDAPRAFGIAMTLGCVAGRDALAAAERVLFAASPDDTEFFAAFAAALKISPHDRLPLALRSLLAGASPEHRAIAIDVLGARGLATRAELARASADAPPVAAMAIPHLALSGDPSLGAAIDAAMSIDHPALREAAWIAMAIAGHPRSRAALEAGIAGPSAETAAILLAISGDARDAARLLEAATTTPTRALITAVGWAGAARAVGPLMGLLDHADDAVRAAAAYALDRITGAGMWEEVATLAEEIAVDDPPEPDVGEPRPLRLSRALGDPRDLPPDPALEIIRRPTTNVDRWRAFWADRGPSYDMGARYRRGVPYCPLVSLREIDEHPCTPAERRTLQRELLIRTGDLVRLDPLDLVVTQEEAIAAWKPLAARASAQPGAWVRPGQR